MNFLPPAEVKPGQEYTGPVENLYPCFDGKELVYRFCVFTSQNIQKVYISVDGQKVWAPVLPSLNITNGQQYQGFKETKDIILLLCGCMAQEESVCNLIKEKYKDRTPEETISIIKQFFNNRGFTIRESYRPSNINTHSFGIELYYKDYYITSSNGKGMTKEFALASGMGELYERFHNNPYNPAEIGEKVAALYGDCIFDIFITIII